YLRAGHPCRDVTAGAGRAGVAGAGIDARRYREEVVRLAQHDQDPVAQHLPQARRAHAGGSDRPGARSQAAAGPPVAVAERARIRAASRRSSAHTTPASAANPTPSTHTAVHPPALHAIVPSAEPDAAPMK